MVTVEPISNFETNAGSFRGEKNRPGTPTADGPAAKAGASPAAFHEFMKARQRAKPVNKTKLALPAKPITPTEERMAKTDKPSRTTSGIYRAPHPIERLRDQGKLDPNPDVNTGMFEAAEKLYTHFYQAGLKGIGAQDLSTCAGGGDGGACQFPASERAMHHREKFREATRVMGWYIDAPYRGAGRLVVDVVCFERTVEDAARCHMLSNRTDTVKAAGMEKLCEGLFLLASHWRLF